MARRRRLLVGLICVLAAGCQAKTEEQSTPNTATGQAALQTSSAKPAAPTAAKLNIPPPPDVAAPPADAIRTKSGLASKVLKVGEGKTKPLATDIVRVHYTGWTTDGVAFGSTRNTGKPKTVPLHAPGIVGMAEALTSMVVGEQRRFWIPESLAGRGLPGKPAGTLVFDIELLGIVTPQAPEQVAAAPDDAQKSATGIAFKILAPGSSAAQPKPTNKVLVHFTIWGEDGTLVKTSLNDDSPAEIPVDEALPSWSEALLGMQLGELRRIWLPKDGERTDAMPKGNIVVDLELVAIGA
jgi:peptidylprolyl isomerase